jgi:hypothetical protein
MAAHLHVDGPQSGYPQMSMMRNIGSSLYIRVFVWIADSYGNADLIAFENGTGGFVSVYTSGGLSVEPVGFVTEPFARATSNVTLAPNTWQCVEVMVDQPTQELRVWHDGAEVDALHIPNMNLASQTLADVRLYGDTQDSNPAAPVDRWFDEIAIDSAQIGCN